MQQYDDFGDGTAGSQGAEYTGTASNEQTQTAIDSGNSSSASGSASSSNVDWGKLIGAAGSLYANRGSGGSKPSPELQAALVALMQDSTTNRAQFSKDAASKDSEASVAALFRDFKNTALPKIYGAQTGSGGYNSTGAQLLANDAYGSAVAKAAELKLKTISEYERNKNMQLEQLAKLLGTQGATTKGATAAEKDGKTKDWATLLKAGMAAYGAYSGSGSAS